MASKKVKIAKHNADIDRLRIEQTNLMQQMKGGDLSPSDFLTISRAYNSIGNKIYVIERKIGHIKEGKHELGSGDELEFEKSVGE